MRLPELAAQLGAQLVTADGPDSVAEIEITGVASSSLARAAHLVFAENETALSAAQASQAAAILTRSSITERTDHKPLLLVAHPKLAFARAAKLLNTADQETGVHAAAVVAATASLAAEVFVGAGAVIEENVFVGNNSRIDAGAVVGAGVRIGSDCHLYPRVVLYPGTELGDRVIVHAGAVLGSDGFGYVRDGTTGEYTQFPQQGRLIVEDDVEIGANTTIDRGALEVTRIGRGTKIDNLVHLGHNVSVGSNVVIASQTGVSGSCSIGDGAILGGQVGIGEHAEIGPGVIIGGQGGILPGKRIHGPGIILWGTPVQPVKDYLRGLATLARLTRRSR